MKYCKYLREASEACCILQRIYDHRFCWHGEILMSECKYFADVSEDRWLELLNESDDTFLRREGLC